MNIDTITAMFLILFALSNVLLAIAIFYGANIVKAWGNAVVKRVETLTDKIEELDAKKEDEVSKTIRNQILENLRARWTRPEIRVQDDDKPLDFPNDGREG